MSRSLVVLVAALAVAAPAVAAETWEVNGLCAGGSTFALAVSPVDPATMMINSDMSEAFVSHDAGKTWQMIHHLQLMSSTNVSPVFDPKSADRAIAADGGGPELRVTTDGCRTWKTWAAGDLWKKDRLSSLYIDPDKPEHVLVGTSAGAFVTDDDGKTWAPCASVAGKVWGFAVDRASPAAKRVVFAGTEGGAMRSEDGGKTFADASAGLPDKKLLGFAGGSKPPMLRLYATVACKLEDGTLTGGVYVSRDGAKTWQRCMNPNIDVATKKMSDYAHGDLPHYTFTLTSDANPERAYVHDGGVSYMPPNHSTVYRTDDSGAKWVPTLFSDPRFKDQYNVDPDWTSTTIGQKWQDVPWSMAACNSNPDLVVMCASAYVYRTDNAGQHWKTCYSQPSADGKSWVSNGLGVTSTWNFYIDPHEKNRWYIGYTDIGFARSLDAGKSWLWTGPKMPGKWSNTTYELALDPDVPGRIWGAFSNSHDIPNGNAILYGHKLIMQGGVGVSTDFGATWAPCTLPQAPCMSVVLDPTSPKDSRTLWASLYEKGLYRSDDGGKTWQEKSKGLGTAENMRPLKIVRTKDGTLYTVVTAKKMADGKFDQDGVGLYRSTDKGDSWTKITQSLPLHWIKDFAVDPKDPKTIYFGASQCRFFPDEGGLYRTTDGGATWKKVVQKGREHFGAYFHPTKPGWIYMTLSEGRSDSGLWLSKDSGETWLPFSDLPYTNIQRVHFNPDDPEHLILTTFGASIMKGPIEPGK